MHEEVLHADGLRPAPRSAPPGKAARMSELQQELPLALVVLQGRQMQKELIAR